MFCKAIRFIDVTLYVLLCKINVVLWLIVYESKAHDQFNNYGSNY